MQQIHKGLSLNIINKIAVKENCEPLVPIIESEKIKLLKDHRYLSPQLRKTAYELLMSVGDNLPEGYKLLVITAYRPIWMQKELYKNRLKQLAKRKFLLMIFLYPLWKKIVNRYTAPPGGSSHQCGGAVDVTLIDIQGKELDMGSTLTDYGERVHTENNLITAEQKKNRKLLYDVMTRAGFVNYPLEWWHYSYGDKTWAAYTLKNECCYGPITV